MFATTIPQGFHGVRGAVPAGNRPRGRRIAGGTGEFFAAVKHAVLVLLYIAMILAILAVLFVPSVISGARR